jgi:hypothetical protein
MTSIKKLLSISGAPIGCGAVETSIGQPNGLGGLGRELQALLQNKNGFYAFESALHVLPASRNEEQMTLARWNALDLWRFEYGELTEGKLFFAEDAFGNQFCLDHEHVCSFDAETGELNDLGTNLESWAANLLKDYRVLTGHPLIHEWQVKNGALPVGTRLMPKTPFVLGGEYSLKNLYSLDATRGMKSRGNLARQLKNLPDGARVEFRVVE